MFNSYNKSKQVGNQFWYFDLVVHLADNVHQVFYSFTTIDFERFTFIGVILSDIATNEEEI